MVVAVAVAAVVRQRAITQRAAIAHVIPILDATKQVPFAVAQMSGG